MSNNPEDVFLLSAAIVTAVWLIVAFGVSALLIYLSRPRN